MNQNRRILSESVEQIQSEPPEFGCTYPNTRFRTLCVPETMVELTTPAAKINGPYILNADLLQDIKIKDNAR